MTTLLRAIGIFVIVAAATISPVATSAQELDGGSLWEKLNAIQTAQGKEAADAQFAALSPGEQQAVIDYISDTTISVVEISSAQETAPPSATLSGCWSTAYAVEVRQSLTRVLFYRYHQSMYWCGNGSFPYNRSCSAWPSDTGWGWWFDSHITYCQLVQQGYYFYYFSQGKFCAGVYFCQMTGTPWIRHHGGANGEAWLYYGY